MSERNLTFLDEVLPAQPELFLSGAPLPVGVLGPISRMYAQGKRGVCFFQESQKGFLA